MTVFAASCGILIFPFALLGIAACKKGSISYAVLFTILAVLFILLGIYSFYKTGG